MPYSLSPQGAYIFEDDNLLPKTCQVTLPDVKDSLIIAPLTGAKSQICRLEKFFQPVRFVRNESNVLSALIRGKQNTLKTLSVFRDLSPMLHKSVTRTQSTPSFLLSTESF